MNHADLNRAVARATGESVSTIRRMGFGPTGPEFDIDDDVSTQHGPSVIDWDELRAQRYSGNCEGSVFHDLALL